MKNAQLFSAHVTLPSKGQNSKKIERKKKKLYLLITKTQIVNQSYEFSSASLKV